MLILPIKKKWFDMIVSGEKKQEYRDIRPFYTVRLNRLGFIGTPIDMTVMIRNGYSVKSPSIICEVRLHVGFGREEWGAELFKSYYCFDILKIVGKDVE